MRTVYIRDLYGEVKALGYGATLTFLSNGMVQIEDLYESYLLDKSNVYVVADRVEELLN